MRVAVCVTPNASADMVGGRSEDAAGRGFLTARVRSVPQDSKANTDVEKRLANAFGLPKSIVQAGTGQTAVLKRVEIDCAEGRAPARQIRGWTGDDR